jgi:hypothetical protein
MTEAKKPTREELLAAKLQKIEEQRKAVLDKLNKERIRARSRVQGMERKRRSRALILIGASCELAIKADSTNIEKVKALIMKHLTKEADQALVNEFLSELSPQGGE